VHYHDAQLMGANTLREEPGGYAKDWDFGIDDEELMAYRRERLGLGNTKVIVLTGSGKVDVSLPVFRLEHAFRFSRYRHREPKVSP